MDSEILADMGWREGLIAIVVLLAVYLLIVFLRYRRLHREKDVAQAHGSLAARSAVAAYAAVQEPVLDVAPLAAAAAESAAAAPLLADAPAFAWNEAPAPADTRVERLLATMERELGQLRREVGGLRAEVLLLREAQQRETAKTKVVEKVSPIYSDAMEMAMQGKDAALISLHCGISRAEAELVVALVRNRES